MTLEYLIVSMLLTLNVLFLYLALGSGGFFVAALVALFAIFGFAACLDMGAKKKDEA